MKSIGILGSRALLLAGALLAPPASAAAQTGLTLERLFDSTDFTPATLEIHWTGDGQEFVVTEDNESSRGTDLWVEGIRTGKRTRLVEGAALRAADSTSAEVESFQWSPDRTRLLLFSNAQKVWRQYTRGTYFVYDVRTGRVTPISTRPGGQMFAKFSPDGGRVGFVRDNDLFVVDLATGQERQLTTDGSETIINGTTDWVYEEELDLRDAWRWSPDGRRIAYWRFDQSAIRPFHLLDELSLYNQPRPIRYPKPGTPNSRVRIGVIDLGGGATTWMDVGDDPDVYLARMDFAESPTELVIQRLNRHQNRLDLLLGDVTTGRTRPLFAETAPAWVDVDDDLTWIRGGRQLLWTSERDGYNHIYLYDRQGRLLRQLTQGPWEVSTINGVDERNGWVYFTAANPTPMERQLFRVRLEGSRMQRLSTEPGTHVMDLSPDASTYLDSYSRNGVPRVYRLHSADGRLIRVLEENAEVAANLAAAGVRAPEMFTFTTSDGVRLNGWMIRPPSFDPARRYPVLMYAYGGPGSQTVTDAWQGTRYLWHQLLAQRGYLVVSVDNRGTGARGREFKRLVYRNLGRWESNDQIEAARHLASLAYVDPARIGIWGWSYGGYLTALTLMRGGELFRAGISVAPVTDWHLYDTIYTERFMRTPRENPEGYRESSPLALADRLRSRFLLVHGSGDDNVHFQNSAQLAEALQEADRQFDFMVYPNDDHSINSGNSTKHLYTLMTRWVEGNL